MAYIKLEDALKLLDRNSITKKITLVDGVSIYDSIKSLPTADVEEVVRCRNCKHAYFRYNTKDTLQEIYACKKRPAGRTHKKVSGDFFCKHGERGDA